ncbi:MAG: HAMP domain-containing histidine kinase [Bacteroidetes bacterium]|nr:HAMP domain-containing histidine kinase [Bacteroidota bacterium]
MSPTSTNTEIQARLAAQAFELLLAKSAQLLFLTDKAGIITRANSSAETLAGRSLRGTSIHENIIDFQGGLTLEKLSASERDGQILHLTTASGEPASFRFFVRRTDAGYMLLAESTDSDLRHLRSELMKLTVEMGDLNRELQRRNVQLQALSETKNQFLGIAAHDLRNPLGVLLAFSDILLHGDAGEINGQQRDFLMEIRESSEFMLGLINSLLDYTAIESGKLTLEKSTFDLSSHIRRNAERNRLIAGKKNITIVAELEEHLPQVPLDKGKFEQILNNLLSNAIKFSEAGSTVWLRCTRYAGGVRLEVEDHGPGIPEDQQQLLFKPFSRTTIRPTMGERSTGLGLSIVKRLVEGHGGSISLRSTVGVGTTFRIILPGTNEGVTE